MMEALEEATREDFSSGPVQPTFFQSLLWFSVSHSNHDWKNSAASLQIFRYPSVKFCNGHAHLQFSFLFQQRAQDIFPTVFSDPPDSRASWKLPQATQLGPLEPVFFYSSQMPHQIYLQIFLLYPSYLRLYA